MIRVALTVLPSRSPSPRRRPVSSRSRRRARGERASEQLSALSPHNSTLARGTAAWRPARSRSPRTDGVRADGNALTSANAIAASPDRRHPYVAADTGSAISAFSLR